MSARVVTPSRKANEPARKARMKTLSCLHCGAPSPEGEFCCAGCAYVYRLLHSEGLETYYKFKDKTTAPADTALLPARDYGWLLIAQAEAERVAGERAPEVFLDVQGISCAGCVWLIEKLFSKQPGAGRIDVNAQTGQMRLAWVPREFDGAAFARTLQSYSYLVAPASAERSAQPESRALVIRIGLCTAFAMNVMLFTLPTYFGMEATFPYAALFGTLSMVFGTFSLLAGGGYFVGRAWRSLRAGAMNIDLPIGLGVIAAYSGSFYGWLGGDGRFVYFDFVSTFILLMLTGRWAQVAAVERNQRRLLAQQPTPLRVKIIGPDGTPNEQGCEALEVGQVFEVGSGQTIPVDARLQSEEAVLNLAWINGEAEPRAVRAGQSVAAGSINVARSSIRLLAKQGWAQSLLAELMRPAERATYRHRFIERVIRGYLYGILFTATAAGLGWWWLTGDGLRTGSVVTAILVVSCPCAIGLAFPLADEIATVALRKRGVFVRAGDLWPRLQRLRKIVFDKTGTLTFERPILQNPAELEGLGAEERGALIALVADNPHPVALSLHDHLLASGQDEALSGVLVETIGFGVALTQAETVWTLGRVGWRSGIGHTGGLTSRGVTEFSKDGRALARFEFRETLRSDARAEVDALRARGLGIFIASGDGRERVAALTAKLGLEATCGRAELTPQGKADWLSEEGAGDALMLGDGANDSLAFDRALVRGTPVVHRGILAIKADFYYLGRGIGGIRALFEADDARRRTHRWLLGFSIAYNALAVSLAVAGHMSPLLAAILMPASSLATLAIVGLGMKEQGREAMGARLGTADSVSV